MFKTKFHLEKKNKQIVIN